MLVALDVLEHAARTIAATGVRDPNDDFSCTVVLLPHDGHDALYLLVYCEQDVTAALESVPGLEEFCYWDNTDAPAGIGRREWRTRRAVWDEVVGFDPPAARGLSFSLDIRRGLRNVDWDRLLAAVPTAEDRARRVVRHRALAQVTVDPATATLDIFDAASAALDAVERDLAANGVPADVVTALEPLSRDTLTAPCSRT